MICFIRTLLPLTLPPITVMLSHLLTVRLTPRSTWKLPKALWNSEAMLFSLAISFIVTPWAAIRILRWGRQAGAEAAGHGDSGLTEGLFPRLYRGTMRPLISHRGWRWSFLGLLA